MLTLEHVGITLLIAVIVYAYYRLSSRTDTEDHE